MSSFNLSWRSTCFEVPLYEFNQQQESKKSLLISNLQLNNKVKRTQNMVDDKENNQEFESRIITMFLKKQKTREKNNFIPAPPKLLSPKERLSINITNRFKKKYQFLWVLISSPYHPIRKQFLTIYRDDMNLRTNELDNMLKYDEVDKLYYFINGGLDVKIMCDYVSYRKCLNSERQQLQKKMRVLQIHVEEGQNGERPTPSKKTMSASSLVQFVEEVVTEEIERSRKDIAYYNFIHSSSSAQLFNRRSILQDCLFSKSKEQLLENHQRFVQMINDDTLNSFNYKLNDILRNGGTQTQRQKNILLEKTQRKKEINKNFQNQFKHYIENCYPFEDQHKNIKEKIANWAIVQYSVQSSIYAVLNNTIRFSLNKEKIKPVSSFIRYLYEALRYYFTEKHYRFGFIKGEVYRGSRISVGEQRNFIVGQYLWNLGFTSTSRIEKKAFQFLQNIPNEQERVKIIIKFCKHTSNSSYLWEQEGFTCIDQISDISEYIIVDEEEVLFNPLNTFKITQWNKKDRILVLEYAAHLDILERKKNGLFISDSQQQLIYSLSKLKNRAYDRGKQLLEDGDPASAVKYYEFSQDQGQTLTIEQKQTYIQSLIQVGDIQKIDSLLEQFYAEDQSSDEEVEEEELLDVFGTQEMISNQDNTLDKNLDQINHSLQITKLLQATQDFQSANRKAQRTSKMAKTLAIRVPDRQTLLMQVRSYVELSAVKFKVNNTLQSITECLRSLKIIDELASVNFCFNLREIAIFIKNLKILPQSLELLHQVKSNDKFFTIDLNEYKEETLKRIHLIREMDISGEEQLAKSKHPRGNASVVKQGHKRAEQILSEYFEQRKERTEIQEYEQVFIRAYYEIKNLKISTLAHEEDKEKMKDLRQRLFLLKNQQKDLFETQLTVYQILYENLYKTNIDIKPCLSSFKNDFLVRYEEFMRQEQEAFGDSVELAKFLRVSGKVLCEYGQIIEKKGNKITRSQKKGLQQLQEAKTMLQELGSENEGKVFYTFEKTQINNNLTNFYRRHSVGRMQSKYSQISQKYETQADLSQTAEMFTKLIKIANSNKSLHKIDKSINKSFYIVKDTATEIQVLNESINVKLSTSTYEQRLLSCSSSYSQAIDIINKHSSEQAVMQKKLNMAKLHYLMAQNQFRLGLDNRAIEYLLKTNKTLYSALKIDPESITISDFQKQLLYGNKIKIDTLKLESHLKAFKGTKDEQLQYINYLSKIKLFVSQKMNDPLFQAQLNESIGILSTKCCLLHKIVNEKKAFEHLEDSIKIRKLVLGSNNKANAKLYTILHELAEKIKKGSGLQFYETGHKIYGIIDCMSDPFVRLESMILETTFFKSKNQFDKACSIYDETLTFFDSHPNKLIIYYSAEELFNAGSFMWENEKYRKKGLVWIQKSFFYLKTLEKSVEAYLIEKIKKGITKYYQVPLLQFIRIVLHDLIEKFRKIGHPTKKNQYSLELQQFRKKYKNKNSE